MAALAPRLPRWVVQTLLAGWLFATPAIAASYYVNDASTTGDVAFPGCATMGAGSDGLGCGTCASPCRSLQYTYNQLPLSGGDTVYLNTGRYLGGSATTAIFTADNPAKAGTSANFLSFVGPADARGRAAVDGSNVPLALLDGQASAGAGVLIRVNGIRLQSFGITNLSSGDCATTSQLCASGVRISSPPSVTSFETIGLDIYGLTGSQSDAIDIDESNTTCLRCAISNNNFHDSTGGSGETIYITGMNGIQIRGNDLRSWGSQDRAHGITLQGASNTTVENNVIQSVPASAIHINVCPGGNCIGSASNNVIIQNNTFRRNHTLAAAIPNIAGTLQIQSGAGHVIRNNIINPQRYAAIHLASGVGVASDYNGFFIEGTAFVGRIDTTSYPTLPDWQAQSNDLHSLATDPLFVSGTDSHLQSTAGRADAFGNLSFDAVLSPFIDRGDPATSYALERPPHGSRVDLGAYGSSPQNGLTPTTLQILSGQGQTATEGTALANPFVVQLVYSTTSAPAVDVPVTFVALTGGGSTSPAVPISDALGRASTVATLGSVGAQSFEATIAAAGAGTATFTATAVPVSTSAPDAGISPGVDAGVGVDAGSLPLFFRVSCQSSGNSLVGFWPLVSLLLIFGRRRRG